MKIYHPSMCKTISRNLFYIATLLSLFFLSLSSNAEDAVGDVVFARGAVSAQNAAGQMRLLGKNAQVFESDVITTASKSFAVIRLNDGTRLSIRPNSSLVIEEYTDTEGDESAVLRLFRGGLRSISGLLSKRNPDAYKLNTAVATIGIRGTEFDARLCEQDCAEERKSAKKKSVSQSMVVGRVAFLKGAASAKRGNREARKLTRGGPLYESDVIITGAGTYAILVFRDQSRFTLKPETEFKIEEYNYKSDEAEEDSSFFRLVRGGIRSLTGLMSQRNPESYRINTAVATIGIRGTGFDLLWIGPCTTSPDCGLVASVWQGEISSDNDAGLNGIGLNQVAQIRSIQTAPELIDTAPVFNVPRPDEVDVDFEALFGVETRSESDAGLYVACYEGHCAMFQEDRELDLGAGEAGYASANGQELVRLERIEPFQANDPYLSTINEAFDTLYELLDDSVIEETEFECVVQ